MSKLWIMAGTYGEYRRARELLARELAQFSSVEWLSQDSIRGVHGGYYIKYGNWYDITDLKELELRVAQAGLRQITIG